MGLFFFLVLLYGIGWTVIEAVKSRKFRDDMKAEFIKTPASHLLVTLWLIPIFMFIGGIFAPKLGDIEFFDTGLKVWQAGGLLSFAGLIFVGPFIKQK